MAFEQYMADPRGRPRKTRLLGQLVSTLLHAPLVALFIYSLLFHERVIVSARDVRELRPTFGGYRIPARLVSEGDIGPGGGGIAGGAPGPAASAGSAAGAGKAVVPRAGRKGRTLYSPVAIRPAEPPEKPEHERVPETAKAETEPETDEELDGENDDTAREGDTLPEDAEREAEALGDALADAGDFGTTAAGTGAGVGGGTGAGPGGGGTGFGGGGLPGGRGAGSGSGRGGRGQGDGAGGQAPNTGDEPGSTKVAFISQTQAAYLRVADSFPRLPDGYFGTFPVGLEVCVTTEGLVSTVTVKQSANADIDAVVIAAARAWRYTPRVVAGAARPFCHPIRVVYTRDRPNQ